MASRTQTAAAAKKAAETKAKVEQNAELSDRLDKMVEDKVAAATNGAAPDEVTAELRRKRAEGVTLSELRASYSQLSLAAIKRATDGITPTTKAAKAGGRKAVTTKRVRPQEPDYDKLPEAKRAEAKAKYEAALAKFEAAEKKAPASEAPKATAAKNGRASRTHTVVDEKPAAKATKKPGVPTRTLGKAPADTDGFDWKAKALPGRVLKLKASGKTIKQITAELGLPAREGVWHRVSLIYRAAADAKGIERQRRNGTK